MDTNRQEAVEPSTPAAPDQHPASAKELSRNQLYTMGKELRNAWQRYEQGEAQRPGEETPLPRRAPENGSVNLEEE